MKKAKILISLSLLLGNIIVSSGQDIKLSYKYPAIEEITNTNSFFGEVVMDPFYNLQDLDNLRVQEWYKAQDSIADTYFSNNHYFNDYLERFTEFQNNQKDRISMIRVNELGNYFYLKYDDTSKVDKLYYKQNLSASEIELFDPSVLGEGIDYITYLKPSFDGEKIAIGFKLNEEDFDSQVVILDVRGRKILEDKITNINPDFGGIEWLPDSSGFIYLYFPVVDRNQPGYKKDSYSVIHFLGDDTTDRKMIFGKNVTIPISENFYPKVKINSSLDKYIIGYAATSSDYYDAYITTLSEILNTNPTWKPFYKEEQKVFFTNGIIKNEDFIYRQGTTEGNRISRVKITNPDFNNPDVLAEGTKEDPITHFEVSKDEIYFSRSKYGVEVSVFKIGNNSKIKKLDTPFKAGYISFFGASIAGNYIGAELDGWTSDYTRYIITADGVLKEEGLNNQVDYPGFEKLVSQQIMIVSHDGTEVPLSLVYNKEVEIDGERPVFIYVYGAYGESLSPFFFPIFLDWAMQGGILAFPHVRGGGEKGKDWHIQGMKNLKHNSWKDLIACTEGLINLGYTRKGLISLYTASAGGITAGMAVNERPDLYSSFIADVPRLHPLGLEASSSASSTSYLEYGTVKDSLEFFGLLNMDPYLNIKPNKHYPATLIMPGYNDDRIPLWDSGKYIAKLQKSNIGRGPILMDIDYVSGHGTLNGYDETVKLYSKIFSFARNHITKSPDN